MAETIYEKLGRLSPGNMLRLPAGAFGPGALEDAISECCPPEGLRAKVKTLEEVGEGALLVGEGLDPPFDQVPLTARFVPDLASSGGALMTLEATPPRTWTLAAGWPALAGTLLEEVAFGDAKLTLGTGVPGAAAKGLAFEASLSMGDGSRWKTMDWLLTALSGQRVKGPIAVVKLLPSPSLGMPAAGFPVFALKLPIGMPSLPVLGDLEPTFVLACLPPPGLKAPVPRAFLEAKLEVGDTVPITLDLSSPAGLVAVDADVSKLSGDLLADLGKLVEVDDLGSFLPKTSSFDPSKAIELVDLGMTIAPAKPAVTSTRIELGSGLKWPLAKGIEIEGLRFQLVVPVDPPPKTPPVFATAFGSVTLPGGELDISGAYGDGFQLAAGLGEGSHVKLTDLLDVFLPVELDADLYLDELEMIAATNGTWSLIVGLDGDWGFPLGNVNVALTKAWLELEHGGDETNGAIGATACLGSGKSALEFDGTWVLHEAFALKGSFPKVELKEVAGLLAGHGPPAGLPEISLEKATASLLVGTGEEKTYDLALAAAASMAGHGLLGEAGFELRKDGSGFGFLLGILLAEDWSPGEAWPALAPVFGALTFERSGFVVSTLSPTAPSLALLDLPSLPKLVGPGATFFSSLALKGKGIGYLGEVLPEGTELDLLAVVDTAEPSKTEISATLREPASQSAVQFRDLSLTLHPEPLKFELAVDAIFKLAQGKAGEEVRLRGLGLLSVEPPDLEVQLTIQNWHEPFGIKRLTVEDFGLDLGVEDELVKVGALGKITIEQEGGDKFLIEIGADFEDFEAPDAIVFQLEDEAGKTLMLSTLIEELTTFKTSKVPVLNGIGFEDLKLWMIANPQGWTIGGYNFPPGVAVHADLSLYSWELTLDIEVHTEKGIKAEGAVNHAIDVLGMLEIAGTDGKSGPSAKVDTAPVAEAGGATPPYLWLDGEISFLGIERTRIHAEVTKSSFDFELEFQFLAEKVKLECKLEDDENFSAGADFEFDLDLRLGPYVWEDIELIPEVHILGPKGAVSLGIEVNKTVVFELAFGLAFGWGEIYVNVSPHISAAELGHDIASLWHTVVGWMEKHLDEVFADVLHDAEKWIAVIKSGLFTVEKTADEIAHALAGWFETGAGDAAKYLNELGFEFEEMVEALVKRFDILAEEAIKLLGEEISACAVSSASRLLSPSAAGAGLPSRTLLDLSRGPVGERMLVHYYVHREELAGLAGGRAGLGRRIAASAPAQGEGATVAVAAVALRAMRSHASPELRAAIEETLPELERREEMDYDEFIGDISR